MGAARLALLREVGLNRERSFTTAQRPHEQNRAIVPLWPMRLLRIPEAFDHPDWLFELKLDGFRTLAFLDGHHCRFVSRSAHPLKFPELAEELAHAVRHDQAVLDDEIVCPR